MKIENEYLSVEVNPKGGCLHSIYDKKRQTELLYQPVENSWQGQDVFIFPFIARLKDGYYTVDGKEYKLKNHGLLRYMTGVENQQNNVLTVTFSSDEESKKQYPFDFKAVSKYELDGKTLKVTYIIENLNDCDMPFMIGGHPAFKIPGELKADEFDISGNKVCFADKKERTIVTQDETFSFCKEDKVFTSSDTIELSKELFRKINTIIFNAEDIDHVDLIKKDGSSLRVKKNNIKFLALWSFPYFGDYVAIEPWNGIPDEEDVKREFSKKRGVNILAPHKTYNFSYEIEILK